MINIKISLPGEKPNASFVEFIDKQSTINDKYKFYINTDIEKADYWFVLEDLYREKESCIVDKNKIIYLNNETSFPNSYFLNNYMKLFMAQFHRQYGCYENYSENYFSAMPFLPWMINYKSNTNILDETGKDINFLKNFYSKKTKPISIICSNKVFTENHKIRYEFAKKLKNHFGNNLEWFGEGVNPIDNKWEGIKDYKYHIVLENAQRNNLISEKLLDSYLGLSYPLYFGAPNVTDYFSNKSLQTINIYNFKESINTIEKVLTSNIYEKNYESITESRNLVLNKYNFVNRICQIVDAVSAVEDESAIQKVALNDVRSFWRTNTSMKKKIKYNLSRKLRLN